MQILVYINQDDKDAYAVIAEQYKIGAKEGVDAKNVFWHSMIAKYPVLKNRRISLNLRDGYIFEWNSQRDIARGNNVSVY